MNSSNEQIIFEDNFDGQLDEGWSWLREDPDDWRLRGWWTGDLRATRRSGYGQECAAEKLRQTAVMVLMPSK